MWHSGLIRQLLYRWSRFDSQPQRIYFEIFFFCQALKNTHTETQTPKHTNTNTHTDTQREKHTHTHKLSLTFKNILHSRVRPTVSLNLRINNKQIQRSVWFETPAFVLEVVVRVPARANIFRNLFLSGIQKDTHRQKHTQTHTQIEINTHRQHTHSKPFHIV